MTEREFAVEVVQRLRDAGHEALFAGGCVRDELLGLEPKDHDVATSAWPEQVQALFRRTVAVGEAFGVVEVLGPRPHKVQVATFRKDLGYADGRRPEGVEFCGAEEDAKRRDFTINGMFLDPLDGNRVIDHVGGRADLEAKVLRAIGDPAERFAEDYLRMLRAVRMTARFGLTMDESTSEAVKRHAAKLGHGVSAERIAEELRKMLAHPARLEAMTLLCRSSLAPLVLPEMTDPTGVACLEEDASFELAMAAMLATPQDARRASLRLKLANEERERIEWLVGKRGVLETERRASKLKPIMVHPGFWELADLHRAESSASRIDEVLALRAKWEAESTLNPPPLLTGDDLVAEGMKPGPKFKTILEAVRDAQLDGDITTREQAMELARSR
ncbi:MAG: CCA tRNA nucleotidyltransferase [Gemmataceae bacterium]|nr:CCA tRNA nucleotidyltransferase [Gemmataceae bacterium]